MLRCYYMLYEAIIRHAAPPLRYVIFDMMPFRDAADATPIRRRCFADIDARLTLLFTTRHATLLPDFRLFISALMLRRRH